MNFDSYMSDGGTTKKIIANPIKYQADANIKAPVKVTIPAEPTAPTTNYAAPAPAVAQPAAVTPVKVQAPPVGSVGIADTLRAQGYTVDWNKDQGVLVNGKPINTAGFTLINGRYYASPSALNNALTSSGVIASNVVPTSPTQISATSTDVPATANANKSQFDELMALLLGMTNTPDAAPKYMDAGTARNMASGEISPEYATAMTELDRLLNIDMEKRGLFNSPLASGILTEKTGALKASEQSEIAKRMNEILQTDKADANTAAQLSLQSKNARMDTLSALLNTLSNRELSVAEMTGVINGVKTLAAQEFEETQRMNDVKTKISVADLTGMYNGIPTLAGKDAEVKIWATKMDAAINEVGMFGEVRTQATADILGVPVGTKSYEAVKAAEDRAQDWKMLMTEISNSTSGASSGSSESKTTLNQDLAMWEIMGIAPNTDNLKAYGIAPGTKWTQSAAEALAEKEAATTLAGIEEEEAFTAKVATTAKNYGISEDTAAALLSLFENTNRDSAFAKFNANKEELRKEGVDVVFLESQLNKRFPKIEKKDNRPNEVDDSPYEVDMVGGLTP